MAAFFRFLALLLFWPTLAFGQSNIIVGSPPFSGTAIGNGQALTGPLFLPANASLVFNLPLSYAYWIKTTAIPQASIVWLFGTNPASRSTGGFLSFSEIPPGNASMGFNNTISPTASISPFPCDATASLTSTGRTCARNTLLNDGNWHHVCQTWTTGAGELYVDGIRRDRNPSPGTYTPQNTFWQMNIASSSITYRDAAISIRAWSPSECALAWNRGLAGFSLAGTSLLDSFAVSYWPLNNCTGSGLTLACPDSIASNNWSADGTAPTVAVTIPANGASGVTGDITVTATCTDSVGISNGTLVIDGFTLATSFTASPFTSIFHTTWLKDGSHTAVATCTNVAGLLSTSATNTFTTANGNTGNTYYVSDNSGSSTCNDANNGTATSTPWCSLARINQGPTTPGTQYGPGDKILLGGGENWAISTNTYTGAGAKLSFGGPPGGFNSTPSNIGNAWGNGVTVSTFDDGHGVSCAPPSTITGCATFTVSIPSSASVGTTFPLYMGGVVQVFNANGTTITNIRVVGSGTSQLYCCQNLSAILIGATSSVAFLGQWIGNVVTNTEVLDMAGGFGGGISILQTAGALSNTTISNNVVHGTSVVSTTQAVNNGIGCVGACRAATLSGNLVYNIPGYPNTATNPNPLNGYDAGCCGNGIKFINGASGGTMQFNLVHDIGQNTNQCGGNVALYDFNGSKNTIQFNEVFNALPINFPSSTGCDNDAIDLDTTVSGDLVQYNYTHNDWGGITGFIGPNWGVAANGGPNVIRFNISENESLSGNDATGGLTGFGPTAGGVYMYNNIFYSNKNGTQGNGVNTTFVRVSGFGWYCMAAGSIFANNIFALSQDHFNATRFANRPNGGSTWCPNETWKANDWYAINGSSAGWSWNTNTTSVATLAAWQGVTPGGDTGATTANPTFAGTVGLNLQCITTTGSTGPGNCPANYALGGGSTLLGAAYTGLTAAPYNQTITRDYFNNACSGGNVHNIGAAGCQ